MVDMSLFYSHLSSRTPVFKENYHGVGYTVARSVDAINCRVSGSPLLNHHQSYIFRFKKHTFMVP